VRWYPEQVPRQNSLVPLSQLQLAVQRDTAAPLQPDRVVGTVQAGKHSSVAQGRLTSPHDCAVHMVSMQCVLEEDMVAAEGNGIWGVERTDTLHLPRWLSPPRTRQNTDVM
jgi:hypothetical protein